MTPSEPRRENSASRPLRGGGLLVVLASLSFAIAPLLRPGLPAVADAAIHFYRTAEWVRVWGAGVIYPRWSPNLAFGYGFPLFIFAPPLPYAVAGALNEAGLSLASAIKALPVLGFILMGWGMYLFVRDTLGSKAGIVAAVAFAYAPFVLREAYIYGGNYPQFLAVALFPWVLWTFRGAALRGGWVNVATAGLAYGALVLTHIFHAMIFTPVVAAYVVGVAWTAHPGLGNDVSPVEQAGHSAQRLTMCLRAVGAGLLGLALSAAFLGPALYERQWSPAGETFYVTRSTFVLRFLSFSELFSGPQPIDVRAANPYVPFALGWVIAFFAVLGLLACVMWRRWSASRRFHVVFFTGLLAVAAFMVLPISQPVWAGAPFLAVGEFPWRFMGVASLAVAFVAGASTLWIEQWSDSSRWGSIRAAWMAVVVAVLLLVGGSMPLTYPRAFLPPGTPTVADSVRYELSTQAIGTTTLGEYVPIWVKDVPVTSPLVDDYLSGRPVDKLDRATLPSGATAERLEHSPIVDAYRVSSASAWTLRLNTFYYPGWTAAVDGNPVVVTPDGPRGLISVPVPAGEHTVAVRFGSIPARTAAGWTSVAALALTVLGLAYTAVRSATTAPSRASLERPDAAPVRFYDLKGAGAVAVILLLVFALKAAWIDPHTDWFRRQSPPNAVVGAEHPTRVNFGDKVMLLGYDLDGEPSAAGRSVHVRLYWQALGPVGEDYSTFVHLDALPNLQTRAQSDNVQPGDARAQIDVPVRIWTTDTYVRDEHTLGIPADLPPVAYALRVGLYDRDGRRLSVLDESGHGTEDAAFLQPLHLLPPQGPPALKDLADARGYRFGDRIELLGTRLEATSIPAGQPLRLRVFWRATAAPVRDYTVFVHVLDATGKVVAQADGQPVNGAYPTSWWLPGQVIEDAREVALSGLPAGAYQLALGVYDLASGERLPVTTGDGELPERRILLEQSIEVH